jgi:hypothetical protein
VTTVEEIAGLRGEARAAVADALGPWVLVCSCPTEGDEWSYRTLSARLYPVRSPDGKELALGADFHVFGLKKDPGKPFADTILIGRASSNDVTLEHPSVSKLHARMTVRGPELAVSDAGSSNGTFLGDDQLKPDEQRPVGDGAVLMFGSCSGFLMSTERLLAKIRS